MESNPKNEKCYLCQQHAPVIVVEGHKDRLANHNDPASGRCYGSGRSVEENERLVRKYGYKPRPEAQPQTGGEQ